VSVKEPIHGGTGVLGGRLRYAKEELSGGILKYSQSQVLMLGPWESEFAGKYIPS